MIPLLIALAADPAPACFTQEQAIAALAEVGGTVVGSAHYSGAVTTDTLVFEMPDKIIMVGFNAVGCYVGQVVLEPRAPETGA